MNSAVFPVFLRVALALVMLPVQPSGRGRRGFERQPDCWFGVGKRRSISSAMEVGIHNGTMAITIAVSVLGNETMAVPAAMYSVLMFIPAALAARFLTRPALVSPQW
jgi:hypothetical protein